ncbi:MAG: hypothetical protein PGN30_18780 [Mycolicibacterium neoaurum]|uniref:hypothetical protein n=1 Tax=Mycolicibacterium neoaurum TaxID=1795 RepID=UPI00068E8FD9|nr:hypothetical protein [Mycolicibacterium neoaurum]SDD11307.1 hypothetical protein SAMN04488581_1906 [Mycolicibacterium neoaurum]
MSLLIVGLLMVVGAVVVLLLGLGVRTLVGRRADAADSAELDEKILMPTIVVACGLVVTAAFVVGYDLIV